MSKSRFRLQAILFDLDNTLILFDEERYFGAYMRKIAMAFADLMPPDQFASLILASTQSLLENRGKRLNVDHFMKVFSGLMKAPADELWDRFEAFYAAEYDQFRSLVRPTPDVLNVFNEIKSLPIKRILATNPMWPEHIQEKRVIWSGLKPDDFHFIAHISNSTFCKPQIEYYEEICRLTRVDPEHCLMVGDDPVNDMIAGELGMKTYLTLDAGTHNEQRPMSEELRAAQPISAPDPDFTGLLSGLPDVVNRLMKGAE